MPTIRLPLVGSMNQRGLAGSAALVLNEDQRFLNCTFEVITNPITGKSTVYLVKRPGWGQDSLVAAGSASTGLCKPQSFAATLTAFGETNSVIYHGTGSIGTITGRALHMTETLISGTGNVAIKSSDGSGWYYANDAKTVTAYTGFTSSGSTTVSTISSVGGMYIGQLITGNTIGAGARISTINSATSTIVLTVASSATSTGVALTKEPIAKIISPNFVTTGSSISAFRALDGYLFYTTDDGYINNSDLNSISAYSANARVAVQQSPDPAVAVEVQKETVLAFGFNSNQKFQNAGYSSGSPLQVVKTAVDHVGALDQRSITGLEDDLYYVSTPSEGDIGVYRLRNLVSSRVSTTAVDRIMGTVATSGAIYASSFRIGGYSYAAFVLSTAADGPSSMLLLESGDNTLLESGNKVLIEDTAAQTASFIRMLVYNTTLNIWSEWDCNQATFIDGISSGTANTLVATSRMNTSGKVYTINPTAYGQLYQDDGATFSTEVRTAKIDHGTGDVKSVEKIVLNGDVQAAGTVDLYKSDDDYATWQQLGTFDLTIQRPQITRCGSYRGGRAYKLVHQYNGAFRAESVEITYST